MKVLCGPGHPRLEGEVKATGLVFGILKTFCLVRKPFSALSELDGESNVLNHRFGVDLH